MLTRPGCFGNLDAASLLRLAFIVGVAFLADPRFSHAQQRTALVIGNESYATSPLSNPINDAKLIADTLHGLSFDVIFIDDADLWEMERALREFGDKLKENDGVGFFYYAGHAVQIHGENYLVPIAAEIEAEYEVKHEALGVSKILEELQWHAGNDLNIIVLDACRNNPFRGFFRSPSLGLAGVTGSKGMLIAYATAPNKVASDDGAYARSLASHMRTPGLEIESVFKRVARDVSKHSRGEQVPWYQSSLIEELQLRTKDPASERVSTTAGDTKPLGAQVAIGVYPKRTGEVFRDCADCPEMVVVPAGQFNRGSPRTEKNRNDYEGPQLPVSIAEPFAVGRYEVTFSQWDACVSDGGCKGYLPHDNGLGRGKLPVINVSWIDAQAYVAWLSAKTREPYRLLSEAEWEYVARAGTETPFSFGSTITSDQANYNGKFSYKGGLDQNGRFLGKSAPVGSYPANAFGVHDMHGNVYEWTEDCWHRSYNGAPGDGSAWTSGAACDTRVLRGGSWHNLPWQVRSADRSADSPGKRHILHGFRVARSLER